jgi:Leucine-rich repeat (LRR) protein
MTFNIREYLDSLPEDTIQIDVSGKELTYLPNLLRFNKLEILICSKNKLTSLPPLNKSLKILDCSKNKLSTLCLNNYLKTLRLNENLEKLYCNYNQLTSLPFLNKNLQVLDCSYNKLTFLPQLTHNLLMLNCCCNQLSYIPPLKSKLRKLKVDFNKLYYLPLLNDRLLNDKLHELHFYGNPIYQIISYRFGRGRYRVPLDGINIKINILNNFRYLYYCLKFKNKFNKWLIKSREKKIMAKYHPSKIDELLEKGIEIDNFDLYL